VVQVKNIKNAVGLNLRFISFLIFSLLSGYLAADAYIYQKSDGTILLTNKVNAKADLIKRYKLPKRLQKKIKGHIRFSNKEKNRLLYLDKIRQAAEKHHIPVSLLEALVETESAFDHKALSSAGAMGLTQLMPATAKRFGVTDREDPTQSLNAGARYLKILLTLFKHDVRLALAGYNAGEHTVIRFKYQIPPYKETQRYVKKVMRLYRQKKVKLSPLPLI